MAELIIEPEAEAELEEAGDRYEESVPGLGLISCSRCGGARWSLQRLRFAIRSSVPSRMFGALMPLGGFRTMPLGDAVHVLAFMHPRRRPGYWANRGPLRQ